MSRVTPSSTAPPTPTSRVGGDSLKTDEVATIARALGHPARVAIVQRLADHGPTLTGDIVEDSGLAQSTVSEHLRVLRAAGLVVKRREGTHVWYCVVPGTLATFVDTLADVTDVRDRRCLLGPYAAAVAAPQACGR